MKKILYRVNLAYTSYIIQLRTTDYGIMYAIPWNSKSSVAPRAEEQALAHYVEVVCQQEFIDLHSSRQHIPLSQRPQLVLHGSGR